MKKTKTKLYFENSLTTGSGNGNLMPGGSDLFLQISLKTENEI